MKILLSDIRPLVIVGFHVLNDFLEIIKKTNQNVILSIIRLGMAIGAAHGLIFGDSLKKR